MHTLKKILAIIPARGGSKSILKKNIKPFSGKPLIFYAINAAQKSKYIDKIVVSTDDDEISRCARRYHVDVIKRPPKLAQDKTPMDLVLTHAVNFLEKEKNYSPYAVVLLQPTSPLRRTQHIDEAIKKFLREKVDSLVSVEFFHNHRHEVDSNRRLIPAFTKIANRDKRPPIVMENGALYISNTTLIKQGKIRGNRIGFYVMDHYSSIDIDEPIDFVVAEHLMRALRRRISVR